MPDVIFERIAQARRLLTGDHPDPELAIFVVRDYQEVQDAGLSDLAWAMYQGGASADEAKWFLDRLEAAIKESGEGGE